MESIQGFKIVDMMNEPKSKQLYTPPYNEFYQGMIETIPLAQSIIGDPSEEDIFE